MNLVSLKIQSATLFIIPSPFLITLIFSASPYLTFIVTIFLTLTPFSFPLPASFFPSFLHPSFRLICPHLSSPTLNHSFTAPLILFLPLSLFSSLSLLFFSLSDVRSLFRLPCHHIFHTAPSLNWACIIISYHVEYLITARDERWPPTIPTQTD